MMGSLAGVGVGTWSHHRTLSQGEKESVAEPEGHREPLASLKMERGKIRHTFIKTLLPGTSQP